MREAVLPCGRARPLLRQNRARSACLTIPKALRPVQVMAQMRLHDGPQNLRFLRKSALDVLNHAVDVGQHAGGDAARVHLGMARQKASDEGLKRDHAAIQVRGWVVLSFISHCVHHRPSTPRCCVGQAVPDKGLCAAEPAGCPLAAKDSADVRER